MMKSSGPRTEPWGTPQEDVYQEDRSVTHLTQKQRDDRYGLNQLRTEEGGNALGFFGALTPQTLATPLPDGPGRDQSDVLINCHRQLRRPTRPRGRATSSKRGRIWGALGQTFGGVRRREPPGLDFAGLIYRVGAEIAQVNSFL